MAKYSPERRQKGLTKDNRCWICKEPLDQPAKGRMRLTCSDKCRKARSRALKGKNTHKFNREKKLVERRRSKPFIERTFNKTFFEPILEVNRWLKWYECLACGQPYEVNRMKNGNPVSPYCSDKCAQKTKYHWEKFVDAYEKAHQRGEITPMVEERFWYDKLSPLCPRCGKPFAPNTTLHGKRKRGRPRKYCSDACRKAAYERRWKTKHHGARVHRYRDCLECGIRFDRTDPKGRRINIFCTRRCAGRFLGRAYFIRERMGIKAVVGGRRGHRIALRGAWKHKVKAGSRSVRLSGSQELQKSRTATAGFASRDTFAALPTGGQAEVLCLDSG